MLRDYSGFYTYGILEHPKEALDAQISVIRAAFKLQGDKYDSILYLQSSSNIK